MGRCVLLLCAWCLLSEVKVLRFNYQKMFAVGSVPWKAHPRARLQVPSVQLGRGTFLPWSWHHTGYLHTGGVSHGTLSRRISIWWWYEVLAPALSPHHLPCGLWHPCGGLMQEARLAGDSLCFSFRKNFPPASSLNHVTQALDNWERCRSWWSCQSASPLNRWKTSEIHASTEAWETVVPVEWAFSFQERKTV